MNYHEFECMCHAMLNRRGKAFALHWNINREMAQMAVEEGHRRYTDDADRERDVGHEH